MTETKKAKKAIAGQSHKIDKDTIMHIKDQKEDWSEYIWYSHIKR